MAILTRLYYVDRLVFKENELVNQIFVFAFESSQIFSFCIKKLIDIHTTNRRELIYVIKNIWTLYFKQHASKHVKVMYQKNFITSFSYNYSFDYF